MPNDLIGGLVLVLVLTGCADMGYHDMDRGVGNAVANNVLAQSGKPLPVTGESFFGPVANASMDIYVGSFVKPRPQSSSMSVGLGQGTTAGAGMAPVAGSVVSGGSP